MNPETLKIVLFCVLCLYAGAFVFAFVRKSVIAGLFYSLGFLVCAAGYIYYALQAGYLPLKNLFDVFFTMAVLIYPLSLFFKYVLDVDAWGVDMLIGGLVLVPAVFVFSPEPKPLMPALQSVYFIPHVLAYLLAYLFMTKAAWFGLREMLHKTESPDAAVSVYEAVGYKMACAGFPLMTLGLVLGSLWAQAAWASYWGWDPKEMWALASWLIYLVYFLFRARYGRISPKLNSFWLLTGFVFILLTLLWANLSRLFAGLHNYAT